MTPRPLTDELLSTGLRAHLPVPHNALRERILLEITTTPQQRRLPSFFGRLTDADPVARRRTVLIVALLAMALAASAVVTAGALLQERRITDLSLDPPVELPVVAERGPGWPDTSRNAAGVYSWDRTTCSSQSCGPIGFMHNGYGSGDVTIWIRLVPGEAVSDGATPVIVAGHDGSYRRTDGLERWTVVIEQQTVAITLEARPGTSASDLADAHAIIESMRAEPQDGYPGFRLVFTLGTNDWDSG